MTNLNNEVIATRIPSASRNRLASLQAGRGIAALLVVFYHDSIEIFDSSKYWPSNPVGTTFNFGHMGVEYFFVLSGFIIFHVHRVDIGNPDRWKRFVWRRFTRIYPSYWVVLALLTMVYFARPGWGSGFERTPSAILSSFALVAFGPMRDAALPLTILVVAWTLYHEMMFYGLFLVLIIRRNVGWAIFSGWFFVSALVLLLGRPEPTLFYFYFAPVHLLFGMGMAAAFLLERRTIVPPLMLVSSGLVLIFATILNELWFKAFTNEANTVAYGLGSMGIVLGLAKIEVAGRLRVPRFFALLGDASYSLYLIHVIVLVGIAKICVFIPHRQLVPAIIWYGAFICVAVIAGIAFHLTIEQPLLQALQRRIPRVRQPSVTSTGGLQG